MAYIDEEIKTLTPRLVMEEASRCLLCKDAPCSSLCPAFTDPARFIRAVRFKNFKGAAEVIRENNPLGAICARVCPTEKYCQLGCSRSGIDKPIEIGQIQRFVTDFEASLDMKVWEFGKSNNKLVSIIGSGPSGLTAAIELKKLGYDVNIYEKDNKPGGYLRYGIPEYRLPSSVLDKEIKRITDAGVKIITNTNVDEELFKKLKKESEALILSTGYSKGKVIDLFKDNKKAILAVDFLHKVKDKKGKINCPDNVVIIGGGDVAMDVAVTLKKLGVRNVTDVVYEEFSEFRASKKELELAQKENVTILDGYVPVESKRGNIVVFKHRFIDSMLKIKADLVILATGQVYDDKFSDVKFDNNEAISQNYHVKDNIFVAGDIAKGEKTVVYAVRKGKEVAAYVNSFLGGNK